MPFSLDPFLSLFKKDINDKMAYFINNKIIVKINSIGNQPHVCAMTITKI